MDEPEPEADPTLASLALVPPNHPCNWIENGRRVPSHSEWSNRSNPLERDIVLHVIGDFYGDQINDETGDIYKDQIRDEDNIFYHEWRIDPFRTIVDINDWLVEDPLALRGRLLFEISRIHCELRDQFAHWMRLQEIKTMVEHRTVKWNMGLQGLSRPVPFEGWLDIISQESVRNAWRPAMFENLNRQWREKSDEDNGVDSNTFLSRLPPHELLSRETNIEQCRQLWAEWRPMMEQSYSFYQQLMGVTGRDDSNFVTVNDDYDAVWAMIDSQPDDFVYFDHDEVTQEGMAAIDEAAIESFEQSPNRWHPYHWRLWQGNYYRMVFAPFAVQHNRMMYVPEELYEQLFEQIDANGIGQFPIRPYVAPTQDN